MEGSAEAAACRTAIQAPSETRNGAMAGSRETRTTARRGGTSGGSTPRRTSASKPTRCGLLLDDAPVLPAVHASHTLPRVWGKSTRGFHQTPQEAQGRASGCSASRQRRAYVAYSARVGASAGRMGSHGATSAPQCTSPPREGERGGDDIAAHTPAARHGGPPTRDLRTARFSPKSSDSDDSQILDFGLTFNVKYLRALRNFSCQQLNNTVTVTPSRTIMPPCPAIP